jgi:hypothetical protein
MSKPNTIRIDEVEYVRADSVKKVSGDVKIVILQRGNVVVGRMSVDPTDKDMRVLENAAVIRRWGTTKGLGQIAENGPTSSTTLDKASTIRFHILTTIAIIDCEGSKWDSHL